MTIDRNRLLELLETSGATFVGSVAGLNQAQFHFKPAPERWSIGENVEHVVLAETGSGKLIQGRLTREPTPPDVMAATVDGFARIEKRLAKRDRPFPAPEFVVPTGRWQTAGEMTTMFLQSRHATIETLKRGDHDYGQFAYPHPALGPLTGWQWAYFLVLHALRHVEQIDEVKRAPGYPG